MPVEDRGGDEPPPFVVVVQGPPQARSGGHLALNTLAEQRFAQVGKSTLIKSLVKHYTRHNLHTVKGPVTVVSGKQRRLQLVECGPGLENMIDAAKFADLVLLMVDGNFGFEMETFEFLNILQVHGFPKVMGVLTHLDEFSDPTKLKRVKKTLKARAGGLLVAPADAACSTASGRRFTTAPSCST